MEKPHALIVGGASGIGKATALRLHLRDYRITVADLDDDNGRHVARAIYGHFIHLDAADPDKMFHAVREALNTYGNFDAVVYTAGTQIATRIDALAADEYRQLESVNLWGPVNTVRETAPYMAKDSAYVFVASVAGITDGGPGLTVYGAMKGGVIAFTKSLAKELAPRTRVNCVAPGWTDTGFNEPVKLFSRSHGLGNVPKMETIPLARQAQPKDIANAIAFLASDEAAYITGHTLVVDGGLSI